MRGGAVAAVVALVAAGCLGGGSSDVDVDAADPVMAAPTLFYRPGGWSGDGAEPHALLTGADWATLTALEPPTPELRSTGRPTLEPTIGVLSDGTVVYDAHGGFLQHPGPMRRSTDGGVTWQDVWPEILPGLGTPITTDPYVHVDQDTDRIYNLDMIGVNCQALSWSDDAGASWTGNPLACGHPIGLEDHPTLWTATPRVLATVGYPNLVHYCVYRFADVACTHSLDGGRSFGVLRPLVYSAADAVLLEGGGNPCMQNIGHGTAGPDGRIYLPSGHCGYATVVASADDGLTWTQHRIPDAPMMDIDEDGLWPLEPIVDDPGLPPAAEHEVAIATDEAGNLYAAWTGEDGLMWIAKSPDHGISWDGPVHVEPEGIANADLPTLAAGRDGLVVVGYYGTNDTADQAELADRAPWNAYISLIDWRTGPIAATVQLNPAGDPVLLGPCCSGHHFIDIVVGADGRPWMAVPDTCAGRCLQTWNDTGGVGLAGTWATGPHLRSDGPLPPLAPLPPPRTTGREEFRWQTAHPVDGFLPDPQETQAFQFEVERGAVAIVAEALMDPFDPDNEALAMSVILPDRRAYQAPSTPGPNGPGHRHMAILHDDIVAGVHGASILYAGQDLEVDLAVTVFYEEPPEGFAAL